MKIYHLKAMQQGTGRESLIHNEFNLNTSTYHFVDTMYQTITIFLCSMESVLFL